VLAGATASGAFLLAQGELERSVLADPGIKLSHCDRVQVASGKVRPQALALLVFLSRSGLKPTVGELRCGRTAYTASGLVSAHHATGAIDITAVNGVPIAGHQGAGTITDITIRTLLTIQHRFAAKRIVSLMKYPGAKSTVAEPDHSTFIQVELAARHQTATASKKTGAKAAVHTAGAANGGSVSFLPAPMLDTTQWQRLIEQAGGLRRAKVSRKPSSSAIGDGQAAPGNRGLGARALP
jgi:hypothetical protein